MPLDFPAGTDWRYNNTNYMMLGILIHRVTGQFYGDYLRDQFFAPLGMRATRVISDTDVIEHRASGYEIKGGLLKNQAWVSATFNATADGTLYTTVEDMARWDRALTDGSILKPASFKRMWTPFALAGGKPNTEHYGFGWWIGEMNKHRLIEHSGSWQGFTSNMSRYPDDGLTVAVFVNLDSDHARPASITHVVAGLVSPALMPRLATPLPDDPARAARLRDFLIRAAAGQDMAADYAPVAEYKFDPADKQELASSLPHGWQTSPMVLVRKSDEVGSTRFGYRLGPPGDTRLFGVGLAPSGKLLGYRRSSWMGMKRKSMAHAECPVAPALDLVGDRWSLPVVRDAFDRCRRFGDFQRSLGKSKGFWLRVFARSKRPMSSSTSFPLGRVQVAGTR